MLTCAHLADRLYDEDCRAAFDRGGPLPSDLALHVATCQSCGDIVAGARDDVQRLAAALLISPEPGARAVVALAFDDPAAPIIDSRRVSGSLAGGAVAILLVTGAIDGPLPALWQGAVFVLGGIVAFTVQVMTDGWVVPRLDQAIALSMGLFRGLAS